MKRLHSPDLFDLESSSPEDPEEFGILIQAMVGPVGAEGEESFDFTVCAPKWLSKNINGSKHLFGRHYLIVNRYDYGVINDAISSLCRSVSGSSWQEVAQKLSQHGGWEFENYRS